ncbi:type I secretion system permease/ATPase [Mesorhizobium sp. WSM2239]|uniref:Type I secretion system permease/ATPase n=2 Tax=unclassified Mesorhizobium TaxID=325217 RepID=A0AAU8D842_9HYPH
MFSADTKRYFLKSIVEIGIFSAAANLLLLVFPLYLLQIYDRVLPSSSMDTLVYISLFALASLIVLGLLEVFRAQYAGRVASKLDTVIGSDMFLASMNGPRAGLGDVQPLRDLATVRSFVSSRALFFLFDLPFAPLFIVLLYFIHPLLFVITVVGAVLMIAVAILNQAATSRSGRAASETLVSTMSSAQSFARNFETVRALGMSSNILDLWGNRFADSLAASDKVNKTNAFYSGLSRTIRMVLQIAILGIGAYLVLDGQMTAGMIFASSIISGRALQPLDQIIGGWRQIVDTQRAWQRLKALARGTAAAAAAREHVSLPEPKGALAADQIIYFVPDSDPGAPPLIKRISFKIEAGETVALIGPSQAGKSTLARLIVGAIIPRSGVIRLDGADIKNWDADELGSHLGYLPQDVELFPGTIAQNISRFDPQAVDEEIVAAAQRAQVHELILRQKAGYATEIGPVGVRLSGGEKQRIGLARAFYGDPKLIVLDEPNANLDAEGEQALEKSILEARARKRTVVIITHKPSIAGKCDRVLMLRDGQIELYGPAKDVLQRLTQGPQKAPETQPATARSDTGESVRVSVG